MKTNIRQDLLETFAANGIDRVDVGLVRFTDECNANIYVFSDGTVIRFNQKGTIAVVPSYEYHGIRVVKAIDNNLMTVSNLLVAKSAEHNIQMVSNNMDWFIWSLKLRVDRGQIKDETAMSLLEAIGYDVTKAKQMQMQELEDVVTYKDVFLHKNGYMYTSMWLVNHVEKPVAVPLHTLIATIFCKNNDESGVVIPNHMDALKINNSYDNLEWVSSKLNMVHSNYTNGIANSAISVEQETLNSGNTDEFWNKLKNREFRYIVYHSNGGSYTNGYFALNRAVSACEARELFLRKEGKNV